MTKALLIGAVAIFGVAGWAWERRTPVATPPAATEADSNMVLIDPYGRATGERCPLKHTAVQADIAGMSARVRVTQRFENTSANKIEAVYTFPLPPEAAVDDMVIRIGDRAIRAEIRTREQARQTYDDARRHGHVAALLDQERPNLFRQSIANIEPGAKIQVELSYVETLRFEEGTYAWRFPMTVGPRYVPSGTNNASELNPKYAPPDVRAGHDIAITARIDAGRAIRSIRSSTHEITTRTDGASRSIVELKNASTIPNKDFVLQYQSATGEISDAVLTHTDRRGGFVNLVLQPPARVTEEDVTPKELVFVLDTSGSMHGLPIQKAKETMRMALAGLYPRDTFNLITFAGETEILFPEPVPATAANLSRAQAFLDQRQGSGGTEMMKAIRAALRPSASRDHVRIVCFMTDGYVGNEFEILDEIKKNQGARVFSFGVGSSVNHFLLDQMAAVSRGEVEYVALNGDSSGVAQRFHERIRNPLLTDVSLDWNGLPVSEVYPSRLPDLFSAKPVVIHARYSGPAQGSITLRGKMRGRLFERRIAVSLPAQAPDHESLASTWARAKIQSIMSENWSAMERGAADPDVQSRITQLGLDYRLMTQFTSFVAVDTSHRTEGGEATKVEVPSEMPEGVSHETTLGSAAVMVRAGKLATAPGVIAYDRAATMTEAIQKKAEIRAVPPPPPPPIPTQKLGIGTVALKADLALQQLLASGPNPADEITVNVWLTEPSREALSLLKGIGFVETGTTRVAKIRTGKVHIRDLEKLAKLDVVQRLALQP